MPTQLKYDSSLSKNTDLVLIVAADGVADLPELQPEEQQFVQQQVQQEAKQVALNRYSHRVYVVVAPEGKTEAAKKEALRQAGHALLKQLKADKVAHITLLDKTASEASLYLAEGLYLSNYQFQKHKTKDVKPSPLQTITVADEKVNEQAVQELAHVLEAVYTVRDLVNEPHSHQTATQLSEQLEAIGQQAGFTTQVLDLIMIQSLKMGGLIAVNQGSEEPATFNILEYKPENAKNTKPYVLVGKGVVYDTGGLSLKPTPNSMDFMKSDMAGAAAVTGILCAVAKNKLPIHVICLIPATDNRPGGNAVAPGDVITMFNGMTVEVMNTDAEGRLILADALCFAKKYDPELVIDFATLTGSAMRAVGKEGLVVMGTAGEEVMGALKKAGDNVHERTVEFPLWEEYKKQLESDIADLKNLGGADAGHITAGKFLEAFTSYPWVHFDIAGTAYLHSEDSYRGKLATGSGVRLVYNYLSALARQSKMDNKFKVKLGISIGDTNGIGPEVVIRTLADQRILNFCTPVIYASADLLKQVKKALREEHFQFQAVDSAQALVPHKINAISCWENEPELTAGNPTAASGKASLDSLLTASSDLKAGLLDGIVTAPIDKDNIQSDDFRFPGHTEFLTSYFDAPESLMLLVSEDLRVATVTGHMPLKDVSSRLTEQLLIQKMTILLDSLQKDFGIQKPRIAVLGLNPHAGEKGLLGREEVEIIRPAVMHMKERGHLVFGPYPADGFFGMRQFRQVDAVLAMYHDQGLIPFKTLAFESGVNYTAGLPIVRTSPDHGTAYDIAAKYTANETSFREALFLACDIIRKRQEAAMPAV